MGLNQVSTAYVNNMFTKVADTTKITTRSSIKGDVQIPRTKLKLSKGNIKIRGPEYYNKIPLAVREAKSVTSFRNRLKRKRTFEI